jgi:thymidylate synthase
MGETYGFNMRHYGGEYKDCHTNYDSEVGFDQLKYVIRFIKNNPTSRRIMINLWNPATQDNAATLPSCLCQYQFYVNTQSKELSLQIYIRSSDYFLANNWNACTGALFVHMICNVYGINLTPGDLTVVTGDTHLYKTHLEQVRENLKRNHIPFPKLVVKSKKKVDDIVDFQFEDLQLIGYRSSSKNCS